MVIDKYIFKSVLYTPNWKKKDWPVFFYSFNSF